MKDFYFKGQRKLQAVMGGGAWPGGLVAAGTLAALRNTYGEEDVEELFFKLIEGHRTPEDEV